MTFTLRLPHGPEPEPWQTFPEPVTVDSDGSVDLPRDSFRDVEKRKVEGGVERITTTYRWHQEPEVATEFFPTPEVEGTQDVEA